MPYIRPPLERTNEPSLSFYAIRTFVIDRANNLLALELTSERTNGFLRQTNEHSLSFYAIYEFFVIDWTDNLLRLERTNEPSLSFYAYEPFGYMSRWNSSSQTNVRTDRRTNKRTKLTWYFELNFAKQTNIVYYRRMHTKRTCNATWTNDKKGTSSFSWQTECIHFILFK